MPGLPTRVDHIIITIILLAVQGPKTRLGSMFHTDRELYRDLRGGRCPKRRPSLPTTISKTRSFWVLTFTLRLSGMRVLLTDTYDNAAIKGASEKETHKLKLIISWGGSLTSHVPKSRNPKRAA